MPIFALAIGNKQVAYLREYSSAGSEHLPYKQRVRGSNPCAPTAKERLRKVASLFFDPNSMARESGNVPLLHFEGENLLDARLLSGGMEDEVTNKFGISGLF